MHCVTTSRRAARISVDAAAARASVLRDARRAIAIDDVAVRRERKRHQRSRPSQRSQTAGRGAQ